MSPKDLVFVAAAMVATIISVISDCEGILRSSCVDLHDKKFCWSTVAAYECC